MFIARLWLLTPCTKISLPPVRRPTGNAWSTSSPWLWPRCPSWPCLIWQGITSSGNPDPTVPNTSQHLGHPRHGGARLSRRAGEHPGAGRDHRGAEPQERPHGQPDLPRREHRASSRRWRRGSPCAASCDDIGGKRSPTWRSRPATGSAGGGRAAGGDELVLPQGLLGRLDFGP